MLEQLIQEINDNITTNGVGDITGAKLHNILIGICAAIAELTPTYEGAAGNVMQSDGNGGLTSNAKVNVTDNGDVSVDGSVSAGGDVNASRNVNTLGDVIVGGSVAAGGNVIVGYSSDPKGVMLYDANGVSWMVKANTDGTLNITQA